jgi:hypothetical protein
MNYCLTYQKLNLSAQTVWKIMAKKPKSIYTIEMFMLVSLKVSGMIVPLTEFL